MTDAEQIATRGQVAHEKQRADDLVVGLVRILKVVHDDRLTDHEILDKVGQRVRQLLHEDEEKRRSW